MPHQVQVYTTHWGRLRITFFCKMFGLEAVLFSISCVKKENEMVYTSSTVVVLFYAHRVIDRLLFFRSI